MSNDNDQSQDGQTDPTNVPDEIEAITNVDQFAERLSHWHQHRCQVVRHMREIPENAVVQFKGVEHPMTGDFRTGYQLGIDMALAQLGQLPFVAEMEDLPKNG